jgi:hypothetical protein
MLQGHRLLGLRVKSGILDECIDKDPQMIFQLEGLDTYTTLANFLLDDID